jgi:hypothetical protein
MNKSTKKRKQAYLESAKKSSPSLELVILDQKPIRKKIISSCKKTIKDLDSARSELLAFEKKDIPEYNRWFNQNFDSELSDVKIAHERAGDAYRLIQEIEDIRSKYSISYYEAYKLALDKRKNPEKYKQEPKEENNYEDFGDDDPNDYYEEEHKFTEDDLLKIFKNFLRSNPDLEEMAKNKKNFTILFEKFKQEFNRKDRKSSSTKQQEPREKPKSEKGIIEQVKSIYRMLARKLHPDYRKETGEHYEILWFEAQSAYKSNNLEKLQTLLSQCNAYEGNFSEEFSIYQIVTAKKNYGLQLKTVRSRIKLAKKDPAWGFSKITHKEAKSKTVEVKNRLKRELTDHKENLIHFNEILKKWSMPPIKSKKSYNRNQYSGFDDDEYITFLF